MTIKNSESTLFCGYSEVAEARQQVSEHNPNAIKLFKIKLSQYSDVIDVLSRALTPLELERARKYHQIKDSNRFIICRSFLKTIIAQRNHLKISDVCFEKSNNHKPFFPLDPSLFFNVSHAGDFALIAIGDCELGVDVEYINPKFQYNDILPTVFSADEIKFIHDSDLERQAFYKLWTRKEAIVKATGKGIDENFIKIPVIDGCHKISSSLVNEFKNLRVSSFKLNDDYISSLAITRDDTSIDSVMFQGNPSLDDVAALIES
ncbi:4'-phosphopantetheinyl transferase family protein [Winogradskyella sediminis]|uniref:4'-phosphopantetheinyl transferase family protein n=1 Tax=Winogradskyella sediminis TaxID=1382466 RepID=UPI003AA7E7EA